MNTEWLALLGSLMLNWRGGKMSAGFEESGKSIYPPGMRVSPSAGSRRVVFRFTELMLSSGEKSVMAPRGSLAVAKRVLKMTFPLCEASRTHSNNGYCATARLGTGSVYQSTTSKRWSVYRTAGSTNGGTSRPPGEG